MLASAMLSNYFSSVFSFIFNIYLLTSTLSCFFFSSKAFSCCSATVYSWCAFYSSSSAIFYNSFIYSTDAF